MKKGLTELVFILDRSGSMAGLEDDTIGGFNSMLEKQKRQEGEVLVSTVLFNQLSEVVHDRLPLSKIPPMTREDYTVGGSTALIDAMGGAIHHIANVHRYIREEDVPEHTVFVITTDGMENCSRSYTAEEVRGMVKKEQEKYGWEFLFLGANINAVETAGHYGIRADRAVRYEADGFGTQVNFHAVSEAVCCVRESRPLEADWSEEVSRHYEKRRRAKSK